LDWQIHTAVNNEPPFAGATVTAGPGTYLDIPTCNQQCGGPQDYFDVCTTSDIATDPANITTGTTPAVATRTVPLVGNIDISGLTDGKFYVIKGTYAESMRTILTMTGPGKTPLTVQRDTPGWGNNNRMISQEFSFTNPGGEYTNIQWVADCGNNTGRRRWGGVLLDGTLFVDTVEPAWVATWPNVSPVSSTLFTVNGNTNEDSTAFYVVLPDGASAPTSAQVKAGNDPSDSPAPFSGSFALSALVPGSKMVTGLTASTAYDVYVVAEDVRGPNLQTTPVLVDVTTNPPDSTPPGWTATYPQQSRTPAGLTGIGNLDEPGNAYFVVLPSGASAPTSAQVKAGNDASDTPAPGGSMSLLTSGVSGSDYVGGLIVGTTYDVYFAAEDLEGNLQVSPQLVSSAPAAAVDQFVTGGFIWGTSSVWSATTLSISNNNSSITVNGPVTGTGGITLSKTGNGTNILNLSSTANTFTGGVDYTSNVVIELNVNSFADTASLGTGNIRFGLGNPSGTTRNRFALNSGATSPLTLTNRQFEITSANNYLAQIYNNSAQAFTINSDLIVSGTGAKTLELGGTGAGTSTFTGDLVNGSGTLVLTKTGTSTWVLSGDNTYTGTTTVTGGTLALVGGSQTSPITVNNGTKLGFTLGSPTTSTASLTLGGTSTITITGTPDGTSDYLLMTAASFSGTPSLDAEVGGYSLELQAGGTQLVLVAPAPSATLVIDLGAGTVIEGGAFGTFGATNLPIPALPVGSILRSVSVNAAITATDNENFASDLAILFDPTPGIPGGDFSLRMTSGAITFGATNQLAWSGGASGPPATLVDTKNAAE
jgi:autotransporter-associated beta strand protein